MHKFSTRTTQAIITDNNGKIQMLHAEIRATKIPREKKARYGMIDLYHRLNRLAEAHPYY